MKTHSITVKVLFDDGAIDSVSTRINGTADEVLAYYAQNGGRINIGNGGNDRIGQVAEVIFHV
ncbi:hypothetical protein ACO0LM_11920 [Undibacterium sp. Di26W]|uniref:hypothetical protein n=1 Tax=Undibacterium sp. Di26W TaxID=3413035 RepID=UPI003BF1440C